MAEKTQTTVYLNFHLRKKLKRVSSILERTESSVMEDALEYYFRNSEIIQQTQEKIQQQDRFFKDINNQKSHAEHISLHGSELLNTREDE